MTDSMNHDELIKYHNDKKREGNPYLGSAPLNIAIFSRAYEIRNDYEGINSLRDFFQKGLRQAPNTLSRAFYMPEGKKDKAIHNYGTPDEYVLEENLVGEDNWIKNIKDKKCLTALFGTSDANKLNKVFQWLNSTDGYLWTLNSKPENKEERVVRFYANSGRLYLGCGRDPAGGCPAFRVEKID